MTLDLKIVPVGSLIFVQSMTAALVNACLSKIQFILDNIEVKKIIVISYHLEVNKVTNHFLRMISNE